MNVIPPGWDYNPSSWWHRVPIVAAAFLGFLTASVLAAYQFGFISHVWEPFFGKGTVQVLESKVSEWFRGSDAALGAFAYLVEVITGLIGGTNRWKTMPWLVIFFGFLIIPVGMVSIILVILQPIAVGAWCTLCLISALLTLIMIAPAFDEVGATVQFLMQKKEPLPPTASPQEVKEGAFEKILSGMELQSVPWNLALSACLGLWIMVSPSFLSFSSGYIGFNEIVAGALITSFSVIAFGEIPRPLRFLNIFLAAWMMAAPFFLQYSVPGFLHNIALGLTVILLSVRKGKILEKHGIWDKYIV